jgi:hypothetical protein
MYQLQVGVRRPTLRVPVRRTGQLFTQGRKHGLVTAERPAAAGLADRLHQAGDFFRLVILTGAVPVDTNDVAVHESPYCLVSVSGVLTEKGYMAVTDR